MRHIYAAQTQHENDLLLSLWNTKNKNESATWLNKILISIIKAKGFVPQRNFRVRLRISTIVANKKAKTLHLVSLCAFSAKL